MQLDRFIGTKETLAAPDWVKPQYLIDAIAERRRKQAWRKARAERAFCPTGDGGGVDNTCSPSDSDSGSSSSPSEGNGGSGSKLPSRPVTSRDISSILQKIAENPDGFTLDPASAEQPASGIMVSEFANDSRRSLKIKASEITSQAAAETFSRWYAANADLLVKDPTRFVGGWKTGDDFYIDIATRFEPSQAAEALEAGRRAGQLAVFNLGTFKETWVQYESGDSRKPKEWDAGFARARKDSSVKQVYDESSPSMDEEDWANELTKHGKNTVRCYNPSERDDHEQQSRTIRHPNQANDHRRLPRVPRLRGSDGEGKGRDARSVVVRGQPGREAAPVRGSASPSQGQAGLASIRDDNYAEASEHARRLAMEASEAVSRSSGTMPFVFFRSLAGASVAYSHSNDTLYVSPTISAEEAESFQQSTSRGWFSQPNPVLHEYSHRYHYLSDPSGYESSRRHELSDEQRALIASSVSGYAATGAAEFVAEYIAGRLSGKSYGDDVRAIVVSVTNGAVRL